MPAQELIGRKIAGKFVIEGFVGGGGMGAVYKARQTDLDKVVAIKVLHAQYAGEPAFVTRFKREARAASRIDHPNSMHVLDFGQEPDGLLYMAMEFLEGRNLHRIIHEDGPLDAPRIANLLRQALAGLAAAHDLKILHRDLKPENIVVLTKTDDEGHKSEIVKVCDFGIAKFTKTGATSAVVPSEKLTEEGTMIGTPDYMAPEQARGHEVDPRSDLYSMGVILYEMLTGKLPFVAEAPVALALMHITDEPKKPSDVRSGVDPRLEAVCLKAMAKQPEARFQTAREMRAALAFGSASAALTPPPSPVKGTLLLVPSETSSTPGVAGPAVAAAPRVAKGSAMATLMAESTRPPTRRPARSVVAAAAVLGLLLGVFGAVSLIRARKGAAPAANVSPSPPAPVTVAAAPPAATSAAPSAVAEEPEPRASVAAAPVPSASPKGWAKASPHASSAIALRAPAPPASAATPPPTTPAATPTSSSAPTPTPSPPPPATQAGAHVVIGAIAAKGIDDGDLRKALPQGRFDQCYRRGIAGASPVPVGSGKLHIVITTNQVEASFSGPSGFESIGMCVNEAAGDIALHASNASADVELSFRAE